jgi:hypothetical protein
MPALASHPRCAASYLTAKRSPRAIPQPCDGGIRGYGPLVAAFDSVPVVRTKYNTTLYAGDRRSAAGGWALLRKSRVLYMESLDMNGGFSSGTSTPFGCWQAETRTRLSLDRSGLRNETQGALVQSRSLFANSSKHWRRLTNALGSMTKSWFVGNSLGRSLYRAYIGGIYLEICILWIA